MEKRTIKIAALQALNGIARPANIREIFEYIIKHQLYTFNSPRPLEIVFTEIKRHTSNSRRTDVRVNDILFVCEKGLSNRDSLLEMHPNGLSLLNKSSVTLTKMDNHLHNLSKDIDVDLDEILNLSATELDAMLETRKTGIEGARRLYIHYGHERDLGLSKEAKHAYLERYGKLMCEACGIEPIKTYGVEIIEAHHKIPLSESCGSRISTIEDFLLLCPSCHRAIHMLPDCDISELINKLNKSKL